MPLKDGAINEILPFAAEGTENSGDVLPLDEYDAHLMRRRGHQPGIAERAVQNTVNRQVAHFAAGTAQFLANRHELGIKDDGDLDKVERAWDRTIQNIIATKRIDTVSPLKGGGGLVDSLELSIEPGPDYYSLFSINNELIWRPTRRFLTAELTLYISPTGDDANLGTDITNPKKTLESALEYLRYIDSAGYNVQIVALPGTYGEDGDMRKLDLSSLPFGMVIRSESDNPKDTVFRGRLTCANSGTLNIRGIGFLFDNIAGEVLDVTGVLRVINGGTVSVMNCEITNGSGRMSVYCAGSLTNIYGTCVVTATKNAHSAFFANIGGTIYYHDASLKITGSYSYAVMGLEDGAILSFTAGTTIAGPATGKRYGVTSNSIINTRGGGANYIPGSIAGTVATGGQYV